MALFVGLIINFVIHQVITETGRCLCRAMIAQTYGNEIIVFSLQDIKVMNS